MTPERWQQVKEIFNSALQHEPAQRSVFLSNACGGDESLRQEVESLISSHEKDGSFIDSPAFEVAAEILTNGKELMVGQRVGHYEILSTLGKGGMGEVYLAEDTRLGRKVALKFLPSSLSGDQDRLRRFELEARAASALNHPNILTIYEVGSADSRQFIATEYVEGETLRQRMAHSHLRVAEALDVAIQVASALAAAHQAGILHRDIKPENIMWRHDGYIKVVDFGLAKLTETENITVDTSQSTALRVDTETGMVMGTTAYMSPEQARGQRVDARTDIWSLGVVLYEMIAGRSPFSGKTNSDVLVSILEREPKALLSPDVPESLDWVLTKALTKDREDRYQTAREMLADLRRVRQRLDLAGEIERSVSPDTSTGKERPAPGALAANRSQSANKRVLAIVLPFALLLALAAGVLIWKKGLLQGSTASKMPMVVLMDSPTPDRVYDPETRKEGGTNADDITDILRDLPIVVQKENTSPLWHREEQVLQQNPTLIVMHRSCFAEADAPFDPQSTAIQVADSKIDAFLGYVGLGNPATKFLIYTRRPDDKGAWASDLEKRFPQLKGRVFTIHVTGGPEHATFRDPTTAQALRHQVQAILGLR
jgi:serine/threonine protein kinase